MMMSPGSMPGSWSPSPWKTIFWPSLIPVEVKSSVFVFSCSLVRQSEKHLDKLSLQSLTFVDVDLQNLLLPHDLPPHAGFAAVLVADPLALALAAVAHGGHLLHHAWDQLVHTDLHPCAVAGHAHLGRSFPTPTTCREK